MKYDNKLCEVSYVLSIFSNKKKNAKKLYLDFMDEMDDVIKNKEEIELAPEYNEIESELNNNSFIKKDIEEINESFEKEYNIELNNLKGKYLKYELIKLRKIYIKKVLKYKAAQQTDLSNFFGITESQISRIYNS